MRFGIIIYAVMVSTAIAQTTQPAQPTPAGRWDQISDRVVFLTRTLATVEASLNAINAQIRQTGYKAAAKSDAAQRAAKGNELMNRNLGMPSSIDWKDFYGRTASRFFYHPTDRHTFYINPHPIADRPPQFDYIYKANAQAQRQAEADAAAMGGKIDALLKRRGELENKQLALWTQIPFESVSYQEVTDKPIYRFELKPPSKTPLDQQHVAAASAATTFVREIDQVMHAAANAINRDPAAAVKKLDSDTSLAAKRFQDALLKQDQLAIEMSATDHPLQQVSAAAKRMAALSRNIAEAQQLAAESASAGEDQAKTQYRAVIQNSLLDYATMVMVADESLERLAHDWNITPDTSHALPEPSEANDELAAAAAPSPTPSSQTAYPPDAVAVKGHHLKIFWEQLDWNEADQRCKEMGGYLAWPATDSGAKFLQRLKGKGKVVWLGGYRGKEGWQTVTGHHIHNRHMKPMPQDQAVVLTSDGSLGVRPFSGDDPGAKVKNVSGFICEWDD